MLLGVKIAFMRHSKVALLGYGIGYGIVAGVVGCLGYLIAFALLVYVTDEIPSRALSVFMYGIPIGGAIAIVIGAATGAMVSYLLVVNQLYKEPKRPEVIGMIATGFVALIIILVIRIMFPGTDGLSVAGFILVPAIIYVALGYYVARLYARRVMG